MRQRIIRIAENAKTVFFISSRERAEVYDPIYAGGYVSISTYPSKTGTRTSRTLLPVSCRL